MNFSVENLEKLLEVLKEEGVTIVGKMEKKRLWEIWLDTRS